MFIPVRIGTGTGAGRRPVYDRMIETSARFDRLGAEAQDMRVPLTAIGEDLHTQMAMAFATEGATGYSGRWTALSDNPPGKGYGSWKAKHGGGPILVGLKRMGPKGQRPQSYGPSGLMRRQLLVPLADRATWHIDKRRLLYAPMSNIAGFHETGTPKMPARPPVDVTVTFLHSVDRQFARWLAGLARQAGL